MRTTLATGEVVNVLAQVWDGEHWKLIPERAFTGTYWWLINYVISATTMSLNYGFNIDDTVHHSVEISSKYVFDNEHKV